MLSEKNLAAINNLARNMDEKQLAWASGFFAGIQAQKNIPPDTDVAITTPAADGAETKATVLYGTQSGNGKNIAEALTQNIKTNGLSAVSINMASYKTTQLKKERFLFVIISTHGEGDPPDTAAAFFSFLWGKRVPQLPHLRYAVLALGDSSYEFFCKTGRDIHARLGELGAKSMADITECDVDYDTAAQQWRANIGGAFAREINPNGANGIGNIIHDNAATIVAPTDLIPNRQNPFAAPVLTNIKLTGSSSGMDAYHMELSLEDSGLTYKPGDSLGIWPENPPASAKRVAALLNTGWESEITLGNERLPLGEWLTKRLELTRLSLPSLKRYGEICNIEKLIQFAEDKKTAMEYLNGRDVADIFTQFPPTTVVEDVLGALRKLTPRLYSLASSPTAREGEAHLLIAISSYSSKLESGGRRDGLCSGYLSSLLMDDKIKVYVNANDTFHLPQDDDTPIIMIGPGTGVAPFRAFMEEREERGAQGKNWLFFGARHRRNGFYYQSEWLEHLKSGLLTRLNAAFSRDSGKKVYVQHLMHENGSEIWRWLQDGAHIYVCGDEAHMAKDVHAALISLIADEGGVDGEEYIAKLGAEGRYRRDVY
ncbi:MAG: flavodoxin domain-containing protein [Candidatus Zeuxoniibacter abyssi]|nr:MAG: flavodoxin domain-containing protein [Candidatus Persebacteraceae bacterium AB1(2)]